MKLTKNFKYSNGDVVKEKKTGLKGTITGTCFYITGRNQYLLVAKSKDEFSEAKSSWYDEGRVELVEEQVVTVDEVLGDKNGCDIPAPNKG